MSKKKKKKELSTDYVIFLMIDLSTEDNGIIRLVHRSKIYEFYSAHKNDIEVILIPMDDGLQYAVLRDLPKPFKEFNISFDLYVSAYNESYHHEDPIYYHIKDFYVRCNDIVDYVRFILSFNLLSTLIENFSTTDDYLNSICFYVERSAYEYIKPNGEVIKDRVRTRDGMITTSLEPYDFMIGLARVLNRNKDIKSHFGFSYGLDDSDVMVVDLQISQWTMLPEFGKYCGDYLSIFGDDKVLSVYSEITNTCVFETPQKIKLLSDFAYFNISIGTFMCNDTDIEFVTSDHKSMFDHLMDTHGFDYVESVISMKELYNGPISDYFENFTMGYFNGANFDNPVMEAILLMVNAQTIARISDIVHSWIGIGIFTVIQFDQEFMSDDGNSVHCFLCEDADMMNIYQKSFYDRFMDKLWKIKNDVTLDSKENPNNFPF